ncbi:MAG: KTSC domain-containing protein [Deltaproteobacteria bacterium]|nr:KTSC domain-containing protein [Deltaproteobacteria bacterium]
MSIELPGRTYNYCNITRRNFDSFEGAGSKGAYFNRHIKGLECA